ncbi:hypothetical protein [Nocardioides baculatus]|uniref:DUF4386 domain-containing protein n=1 Tax=Nocardioides baculatus TaxID=2801337 RepID=A0ABS1L5N8_9ACTN|nr:hypothetical protein [Nocardioides baculatus]MBL0746989.1 hypothetical protein [Nocardioides baculatus]
MTTTTLYRLSALALIMSFVLSLLGGVLHPVIDGQSHSVEVFLAPRSPWAQYLIYAGAVFLMLGLPGGYLFFREELGKLGFVGFTTYMVGNALSAMAHLVVEAFVGPTLAADPQGRHLVSDTGEIFDATSFVVLQAVGGLIFVFGLILIGIALIKAGGIPSWIGIMLVLGVLPLFVPFPERAVVAGLIVEVPRGLMVASLGILMIQRVGAPRTAERELERV